jgi:tetratricopeptide (TPR) repeat protein
MHRGVLPGPCSRKKPILNAIICCCFLLQIASAFAQQIPPEFERKINEGVQALRSGDLDSAESIFSDALRHGIKVPILYHNLGVIAALRGNHSEAVTRFRQALALQPDFGSSRLLLGSSLLALRKDSDAVVELKRAAAILPREPQVHFELGRAYERVGNRIAAVQEFQTLVRLTPEDPEYSYQLGNALAKLSDWAFRQIIVVNPKSARLSQGLAMEYAEQGKYDQALTAYRQTAQSDPKMPEIHLAMALILLNMQKFDEALSETENELKLVPDSKTALTAKAKILRAKGDLPH